MNKKEQNNPQIKANNWTLFLDRDGVLNRKLEDDYVKNLEEFDIFKDSKKALELLSKHFETIVVVTNQQGIGKKLMTEKDLEVIHSYLLEKLPQIHKIYFCADLAKTNSPRRKPAIGMAIDAKEDFCKISFKRSVIVGDSISDMQFGRNAGMKTCFIDEENNSERIENKALIDFQTTSLIAAVPYLIRLTQEN
ncbi:histidinol-phosphate phosphatase family protein [Bernardetia litoralis DSM 6794]|uniref:D,D-heptose 1,7-bisphosphate phosphatase n=1 Tax=Bernardetia litoralis (strain ATCC 23117 / DSM 6794 / NBRC 15988 / NCIMB 1366 / Fx l1 / Sio-4) TaxID=880071 RepID=I4AJF5_BERLS|nr:HAD-IIIA family hydrolase [Bernardetia litoralis]AFM04090.1 histidinol-phosphate phosphatase family protein [Bernardetia litoralis DSM 6794]